MHVSFHGLMVSVDAQQTGEPGFKSLLRHFFKNLTQHLALPLSPAGQKNRHPPLYVHKPVVNSFENRWTICYSGKVIHWTIRKVVHPCWTNSLVGNLQVDETTINCWGHYTENQFGTGVGGGGRADWGARGPILGPEMT
jgi:hypothetical protein